MSEIPEFEIRDNENFRLVYVTGAFGGLAPNDGRMILYVDRLKTRPVKGKPGAEKVEKVIRERQVEIHMSPATWKSIAKWMLNSVEKIEKQFGKIPEEPKGKTPKKPPSGIYG